MPRAGETDLSWEALIEETSASIPAERGKCNRALRLIRQAMGDAEDSDVANAIRHRSRLYRRLWPHLSLTPTALASHWDRLLETPSPGVNLHAEVECMACGGDRFVVREVRVDGSEVYAPCPECGPVLSHL